MYAVARILLGNEEDAIDATQACMLTLWEKVADGLDIESPTAYCLQTVKNYCLSAMRKVHETVSMDSVAEPAYTDTRLEDNSNRNMIIEALNSLPELERNVAHLSIIGEYSNNEIAESLGISQGNVRVILHRGRTKLRNLFNRKDNIIIYAKRSAENRD